MLSRARARGQGMTEYIIIVALIAIAAIGVYSAFGQTLRGQMAAIAQSLAGQSANAARSAANDAGDAAVDQAEADVDLGNFDQPQ